MLLIPSVSLNTNSALRFCFGAKLDRSYIGQWGDSTQVTIWLKSPLGKSIDFQDLSGSSNYLLSKQSSGVTGEIHYVYAGYNVIGMIKPPVNT